MMEYKELDRLANNAVRNVKKNFSFTGAMTETDMKQTAWLGLLSALKQPKYETHPNQSGYLFVFATGYIRHALHRKSRMVKVPCELLQKGHAGHAHLSYTWENLPEPSTPAVTETLKQPAVVLAETFSRYDKAKILEGDFEGLTAQGKQLLEVIKSQYSCIDELYE